MRYVLRWTDADGDRLTAHGSGTALATKMVALMGQGLNPSLEPSQPSAEVLPGSIHRTMSATHPFVVLTDGQSRRYAPVSPHQTAEEQWEAAVQEELLAPMLDHSNTHRG